ncbi:tRNase Z TRZ1 [Linum perenne]
MTLQQIEVSGLIYNLTQSFGTTQLFYPNLSRFSVLRRWSLTIGIRRLQSFQEKLPQTFAPKLQTSFSSNSSQENPLILAASMASNNNNKKEKKNPLMTIQGYPIEGFSIAGLETCIIFPSLDLAFDIGRCPQRAISQKFLFISHAHMDHIGGLPMYVAARELNQMKPPTIIVPTCIKQTVEKLFEVHRQLVGSELDHKLVGLDVGEEIYIRRDLKVKAFRTYHTVRSQGYVVYQVKETLKQEYQNLSSNEIRDLKLSGVQITDTVTHPEIAFTGDTMSDFVLDESNIDVLKANILVMECTFVEDRVAVEHAREYGHTHLCEIIKHANKFQNKAILMIHFSARYTAEEIQEALWKLEAPLAGRVSALLEACHSHYSNLELRCG